jgi:hypothetical protein
MIPSRFSKFTFSIAILCAWAAIPAFAQRGGGSPGGGFHGGGGGGFHGGGGGGFHMSGGSRGGGSRSGISSPPRMGAGYSRSMTAGSPQIGAGSLARPGGNVYRPSYGSSMGGGQRPSFSPPTHAFTEGQWRSFGGTPAGRGSMGFPSEARSSAGAGWHVFGGNRSAGDIRSTRSFSGQGSDVWENAPMARNSVPSSRALSNIRGSFSNSVSGNSRLRPNASFLASSRLATGSAFSSRTILDSPRWNRFGASRNNHRLGFPAGSREFSLRGCWNCGFQWGFGFGWWPGWGFGWPWPGYWNWGPSWIDPWWGWPGYGTYRYPAGYGTGYSFEDNSSYSAPPESYPSSDASATPVDQSPSRSFNTGTIVVPTFLYMKDGSVYSARDYWVEDGKLHYVLTTGAENSVDLGQVDIQRTVDENAKNGVQVTLKPHRGLLDPSPETPPPTTPVPKPQNDLTSQPPTRS